MLEALIAMSLILGVWMTAVDTYHALVLNIAHHERKRAELLEAFDQYELIEQMRSDQYYLQLGGNLKIALESPKSEPTCVPHRYDALHFVASSTTAK